MPMLLEPPRKPRSSTTPSWSSLRLPGFVAAAAGSNTTERPPSECEALYWGAGQCGEWYLHRTEKFMSGGHGPRASEQVLDGVIFEAASGTCEADFRVDTLELSSEIPMVSGPKPRQIDLVPSGGDQLFFGF